MGDPLSISITVCGDGGCGKSSITLRLVRSQWTHEYIQQRPMRRATFTNWNKGTTLRLKTPTPYRAQSTARPTP